jgi:SRSO17 transposase
MRQSLLMELVDHNCWTIAEAAGHRGPHRLQHLLSRAVWDDQQVLDIASAWAGGHLDDRVAVLIVDGTADEKSCTDAVGAARQYSGTVGGVALCQVAVTLTYATSRGHALRGRDSPEDRSRRVTKSMKKMVELKGFEPLTSCMPYKSLLFRNVAGRGPTSSFNR